MADPKDRAWPWSETFKDEVEAAEGGVLFPPGYVPQKGKPLTMPVLDLDPPGAPHCLSQRSPDEVSRRSKGCARGSAGRVRSIGQLVRRFYRLARSPSPLSVCQSRTLATPSDATARSTTSGEFARWQLTGGEGEVEIQCSGASDWRAIPPKSGRVLT